MSDPVHVVPFPQQDPVFVVLASAARTADTNSAVLRNQGALGVVLLVDLTVLAATETVTPNIQIKDPISGLYVTVATFAAIAAVSTRAYYLSPGVSETIAQANVEVQQLALPAWGDWRVFMDHSAAGSHTYSVAALYLY